MPPDSTNSPPKCRPRVLKPYAHKPGPKNQKIKGPKTSAFSNVPSQRNNLTLYDWLQVVDWYDHHQPTSQAETIKYFKNLHDDALLFNQGTLSHHLTKKAVSWIKQSWHLLLQHYLLNVLKLSHDLMLKKPCNYGCSTWNRSEKLSQGQCWLKSMLGLKMHSMCLSKRGYRVKVGFKNSCKRECGMLQRMRVTHDFNQI